MDPMTTNGALDAFATGPQTQAAFDASPQLGAVVDQMRSTGQLRHDWALVRTLLVYKLRSALAQYSTFSIPKEVEDQKALVLTKMETQERAPFTLQRLTEVLLAPLTYYKQLHKFLNAVEKLLFVSSTVDQLTADPPSDFKA
ncbi:hypothetical protein SDRG_01059 [Saprolegnia diclina VS20]|uniref:Uncharacterized protein n=1 Tax=Saprolegnia diclina (strain VS20) TaxID=1156394 RepID=T0R5K5_SAPDV|nr:hypothetical protein SDRG_01059 [Saprolegnia diclina VS20]EQC42221.1 hypothetical protein SDRG_01059 [Saprolegnia diclina VS20]|eukprot:XP_008604790.1 hypothetical protein SDRG_01059 [Saprolegnia diclina VS20]